MAADASQVSSGEQVALPAHTSSGDTAAFPSLGVTLLKLGILLMLFASLAGGAVLAYKTGACKPSLGVSFALCSARRLRKSRATLGSVLRSLSRSRSAA